MSESLSLSNAFPFALLTASTFILLRPLLKHFLPELFPESRSQRHDGLVAKITELKDAVHTLRLQVEKAAKTFQKDRDECERLTRENEALRGEVQRCREEMGPVAEQLELARAIVGTGLDGQVDGQGTGQNGMGGQGDEDAYEYNNGAKLVGESLVALL